MKALTSPGLTTWYFFIFSLLFPRISALCPDKRHHLPNLYSNLEQKKIRNDLQAIFQFESELYKTSLKDFLSTSGPTGCACRAGCKCNRCSCRKEGKLCIEGCSCLNCGNKGTVNSKPVIAIPQKRKINSSVCFILFVSFYYFRYQNGQDTNNFSSKLFVSIKISAVN